MGYINNYKYMYYILYYILLVYLQRIKKTGILKNNKSLHKKTKF